MFALPDELIDLLCIVGPRDRVKAKLDAFRDAGVDTLIVWPIMPDQDERKRQLTMLAELNATT
jgi:alkanesulfonate monooxygenase SsuD/methylene tetrahydromethanopterin reductase-like flavin-dependent oxidoreductase (luciferase family)